MSRQRGIALSSLSGVLLALAYPQASLAFLAWAALVPFFTALLASNSRREAIQNSLAFGLTFFVLTFSWLRYVTFFGWFTVAFVESLFLILFGVLTYECRRFQSLYVRGLGIACSWMAVEIFRSELPVFGLGWNLLAYSQAEWPEIIQVAALGGAYGLSFVIAFVNALTAEAVVLRRSRKGWAYLSRAVRILALAIVIVAGLAFPGRYRIASEGHAPEHILVSVIQGNIPQSVKWEAMARDEILGIHLKLTELAAFDSPHLVVWPEASFPGYFNRDRDRRAVTGIAKRTGIPLLIGAPHYESYHRVFNSAYLVDETGETAQRYDKNYLVPFGEYVPFGPLLSWLRPVAQGLGVSNFSAGTSPEVFELNGPNFPFTVLICFEDVFPSLTRRFADLPVKFLAVITNDAWFGPTGAPFQHFQASVFRAVENGLPIVRAANTGVSGFISHQGVVLDILRDDDGQEIFVSGYHTHSLPLKRVETIYRSGGWLLPYLASGLFVIMIIIRSRRRRS